MFKIKDKIQLTIKLNMDLLQQEVLSIRKIKYWKVINNQLRKTYKMDLTIILNLLYNQILKLIKQKDLLNNLKIAKMLDNN